MKQRISIVFLTLLVSSCAPPIYYQLVELSSDSIKEGVSENQDIKFCYLTIEDVVRHPLVQKIIEAYQ